MSLYRTLKVGAIVWAFLVIFGYDIRAFLGGLATYFVVTYGLRQLLDLFGLNWTWHKKGKVNYVTHHLVKRYRELSVMKDDLIQKIKQDKKTNTMVQEYHQILDNKRTREYEPKNDKQRYQHWKDLLETSAKDSRGFSGLNSLFRSISLFGKKSAS